MRESMPNPARATDLADTAAIARTTMPTTFQLKVTYSSANPRRRSCLRLTSVWVLVTGRSSQSPSARGDAVDMRASSARRHDRMLDNPRLACGVQGEPWRESRLSLARSSSPPRPRPYRFWETPHFHGALLAPAAPLWGDGRFEDVVDGQDADEVVVVVEDGQDEQVVVGHGPGDFGQVSVGVDVDRAGIGQSLHGDVGGALHEGDEADGAGEPLVLVVAEGDHDGLGLHLPGLAHGTDRVGGSAGGRHRQ